VRLEDLLGGQYESRRGRGRRGWQACTKEGEAQEGSREDAEERGREEEKWAKG
jgi:hypothetical protein